MAYDRPEDRRHGPLCRPNVWTSVIEDHPSDEQENMKKGGINRDYTWDKHRTEYIQNRDQTST